MKAVKINLNCIVNNSEDRPIPLSKSYYSSLEDSTKNLLFIITQLDGKKLPAIQVEIGKKIYIINEDQILPLDVIANDIINSINEIKGIKEGPSLTRK